MNMPLERKWVGKEKGVEKAPDFFNEERKYRNPHKATPTKLQVC